VTIWYDVSDLTTWTLPHLTGIQRTTVGIFNGLVAACVTPRLARFDADRGCFVPLDPAELSPAVVAHLTGSAVTGGSRPASPAQTTTPPAASPRRRRWDGREFLFGTSPAATELRTAFRELKGSTRHLRKKLTRWMRVRFRGTTTMRVIAPRAGSRTVPRPLPAPITGGPLLPGDVLLSLGASWPIPGHAEATAALRERGVMVLRMIYDLIPVIKPQWVDEQTVRQVTHWARNVLTASDHVLTISEFSKGEITAYCEESRFPPPPLSIVRLGDELDSSRDEMPPLPRFTPRRPFFLCVSTLDVRKNHRLLYDAWQVLSARHGEACPDLVCVGVRHVYVNDLLREIRQDRAVNARVHMLHGIEDAELAWYYRHCAATIYPSRYEGWGLPVAESLGHGRLCLASSATSIVEISRDLPEFFDPLEPHRLVSLVEKTLAEPAWVRSRETEIRRRFVPTSWTYTARQVLAAVEVARRTNRTRQAA